MNVEHEIGTTTAAAEARFAEAYARSYQLTVRFLVSRGVYGDAAEETAQAAWARAWNRLSQLRNLDMLLSWVNSIAWNMYRSEKRSRYHCVPLDSMMSAYTGVDTLSLDVQRLMHYCSEDQAALLRRYYFDGAEVSELAVEGRVEPVTIRVRLGRARRSIAKRVKLSRARNRKHLLTLQHGRA
jgi:DNA-directed RNA polymerase specialized sigma24 family protein